LDERLHGRQPPTIAANSLRVVSTAKLLITAGAVFAGTAALCVVPMWLAKPAGAGWERIPFVAIACSAAVAPALWWLAVVRPGTTSSWRGALTGLAIVAAAHVLTHYVMAVWLWLMGQTDSLGGPMPGPVEALRGAFIFSAVSLALMPWTMLAGLLVGVLLVRQHR
jgi:hypothetical protein